MLRILNSDYVGEKYATIKINWYVINTYTGICKGELLLLVFARKVIMNEPSSLALIENCVIDSITQQVWSKPQNMSVGGVAAATRFHLTSELFWCLANLGYDVNSLMRKKLHSSHSHATQHQFGNYIIRRWNPFEPDAASVMFFGSDSRYETSIGNADLNSGRSSTRNPFFRVSGISRKMRYMVRHFFNFFPNFWHIWWFFKVFQCLQGFFTFGKSSNIPRIWQKMKKNHIQLV